MSHPFGTIGPLEQRKIFVEISRTNYMFGVDTESSSQKIENEMKLWVPWV